MKGLSTQLLLLLSSVVLLCSAVPALEPVTCSEDGATAARLAMHHINNHHEHGYKFRLLEVKGNTIGKTDTGCSMELSLNLWETECHHVNPKHFEDCEFRPESSGAVTAQCTVKMTLENSDARVNSYNCTTKPALTTEEMMLTCPDCPPLLPLNSKEGLEAVDEAVKHFNSNTSNQHYFVLKEVGRMKLVHILGLQMQYASEIVLQESNCPMGSRIALAACDPLCPERAQHAFCKASYSKTNGITRFECEYYPAAISGPVSPEEQTTCQPAPPINVGPPVPPGPVKPIPGGLSPQPHPHPHPHPHPAMHPCHADHSLVYHPICDWPHQ